MTTADFDRIRSSSTPVTVRLWSKWLRRVVTGSAVPGEVEDEIVIKWDDRKEMTIKRHEVRIFRQIFEPIEVDG